MIHEGDIVVFRFPQTDLRTGKLRPALIVRRTPHRYDDWLVCLLTTQVHQLLDGFDDIILPSDDDFAKASLPEATVIRVTRLVVVHSSVFEGIIGSISSERLTRVRESIARWVR